MMRTSGFFSHPDSPLDPPECGGALNEPLPPFLRSSGLFQLQMFESPFRLLPAHYRAGHWCQRASHPCRTSRERRVSAGARRYLRWEWDGRRSLLTHFSGSVLFSVQENKCQRSDCEDEEEATKACSSEEEE